MKARGYGNWNVKEFTSTLIALSPMADCAEGNVTWYMEDLKNDGNYDSFVAAFREFLLDDSMTFEQKGDLYFDGIGPSGMTWDYCKWLWGLIAPDQQWPLEGRPRPEDEPPPKSYQFKPE